MLMINEHHRGSSHIKLWEYTLNTEVAYFIDYMCQRSEDRDGFLGWWYTGENVFIVVIILQHLGNVCQNLENLKINNFHQSIQCSKYRLHEYWHMYNKMYIK